MAEAAEREGTRPSVGWPAWGDDPDESLIA
jgi:hypothetical protein